MTTVIHPMGHIPGPPAAPPSGQPTQPTDTGPSVGVPSGSPEEQLPTTGTDHTLWFAIVAIGVILVGLVIYSMARRNRA